MTDGLGRFGSIADEPASLLLRGARVVDPTTGRDEVGDVAIDGGVVVAVLRDGARIIDATGWVVAPAFCDLHAHLRQPGGEEAEDVASGTRAAAHSGYATVCAMPNTDPPLDTPAQVAAVLAAGAGAASRVRVVGAATRGRSGAMLADLAALHDAGVVAVSDDGAAIRSARLARSLLAYLAPLGLALFEHAEDATLAAGTLLRGGPTATRLGLPAWPVSAEVTIVERDIALAEETGARLHLTHLSSAAGLDAVRRAKERGLPVTCDVTPHHLALADTWAAGERRWAWEQDPEATDAPPVDAELAYDANLRVNPPLASVRDAQALLDGLADGTIDAIATDHAPHPPQRKLVPWDEAAPGMIGLETALGIGLAAVAAGRLRLPALLAALGDRPARIIGESRSLAIGQPADLVAFDPGASWRVERASLTSRSVNTPLLGRELRGVVRLTVVGGRVTYDATAGG
ncbi:MAG: dihydroorotase [Chloroflexota bacterium]